MSQGIVNLSRRDFLKSSGALTLGLYLPAAGAQTGGPGMAGDKAVGATVFEPNAFVRIGKDGTVTVISKHVEMGQGSYTGIATIVAEELDADWSKVKVEGAPADAKVYNNVFWGPVQGTGGSTAMANSWEQLRKAGASARAMLVAAAAEQWKVPAAEIRVAKGEVMHPQSKRKAGFGALAEAAARQPVPQDVQLKDPKDFVYIGKRVPRKDSPAKTRGMAKFTQDVKLPGMLTAVVAHPPRFGAKLKSFDATQAKAVPGVVDVVAFRTPVREGVAVLAKDFWTAKKGRDALQVEWDESAAFKMGSPEIMAEYKRLAGEPGKPARNDGDLAKGFAGAAKTLEAGYEFPYLAHAALEPMNCVVKLGKDSCEVWNGEQFQTVDQGMIAALVGLKPEQVQIHMLYAGGSFGRRANPQSDYVREAAAIAKAIDGRAPVKLVWTRENDTRAGFYRPMYYHTIKAGLDSQGNLVAWQQRIVGQSILAGTAFEGALVKDGVDATSVEGAASLPYAIPNLGVELATTNATVKVPVQWWRSVGSTHTAYSTETMIDELAKAAGQDPVEFRLKLLDKHPRHAGVLKLAAEKAGWGKPVASGHALGVAVHESFHSYVAQVAEVSLVEGKVKVHRVVCAVDCGVAINPDVIRAQMEGGIGYGLSAALHGKITLKDGQVEQGNFHEYIPLRINEMPVIEVHIVPSAEKPTGVGEPGTPVIAPAVANALAVLTGKRVRSLPFDDFDFGKA